MLMPAGKLARTWLSVVVVLAILVAANASWAAGKLRILHTFTSGDVAAPNGDGPLAFDSSGNLYGTTGTGGSGSGCGGGCGTVFQLRPTSSGWTESVLYNFSNNGDSAYGPQFGVSLDTAGNLYGTASFGAPSCGTIFQLVPNFGGGWTENILHAFNPNNIPGDACNPSSALVSDAAGNLYGLTSSGGTYGEGAAFELTAISGGAWSYSVIYSFGAQFGDSGGPSGNLALDGAGDLFGTSLSGGFYGVGTVFRLSLTSAGWTGTVIYDFTGGDNGQYPEAGVTFDPQGNLYGTTYGGGADAVGVVYQLKPTRRGFWTLHVIHSFTGNNDGGHPSFGSLAIDGKGSLYGETLYGGFYGYGAVFELMKPTTGRGFETVLHSFANGPDGENPSGGLIFDPAGNLYGTVPTGGASGYGIVFEVIP
jgi:uncharacterized repeat protein (TIGR03803 family)